MRVAVTGAFGYSGRYITKRLLEAGHEVITLTNSLHRPNPFGEKVAAFPFHFGEPDKLRDALRGAHALVSNRPAGPCGTGGGSGGYTGRTSWVD